MGGADTALTDKAKVYLGRKLKESISKIIKLKRKRKMVKIVYYSTIILSVSISTITATLSGLALLPIYIIPILSTTSGILTGLSAKFNLQNKKIELNKMIEKLNKIQEKLDYVVSLNGNFTNEDFQQIMTEFSIL